MSPKIFLFEGSGWLTQASTEPSWQSNRSVVIEEPLCELSLVLEQGKARSFTQHSDILLGQARVKEVLQNLTELLYKGLLNSRIDTILNCSFVLGQSLQLLLYLTSINI